jgi:hypothetical protein
MNAQLEPNGQMNHVMGQAVHHSSALISMDWLWIGLRQNLQETSMFHGKINGFRFRFALKPI